jgi:hypothetical protein
MKTGLKKLLPSTKDIKFSTYLTGAPLPKQPQFFGHESLYSDWGVLGNDLYGDCVFAGAAHETMLWNKANGKDVQFTPDAVLSDYAAVTGFDKNNPASDQGTDMRQAFEYRRTTGIVDSKGVRHKLGAYLWLDPKNTDHLYKAIWLFGAVGAGIIFPDSAMQQFNTGKPWKPVKGAKDEGGHYIPLIANRKDGIVCCTWGKAQIMTPAFWKAKGDSCAVLLSEEYLSAGKSPEGFDLAALQADLKAL